MEYHELALGLTPSSLKKKNVTMSMVNGMIELVVGVLLLIGFQVRLVSIITFTILIVTFFFFKEDVYSHVTLFGTLSVLMITGAGPLSLDRIRYPQTRMS
jgi:uncharacterized membrane protein YphA (DoxX/SURF4 family)